MNKILTIVFISIICVFVVNPVWAVYGGRDDNTDPYQPNSLIVKFKDAGTVRLAVGKTSGAAVSLKSARALNIRYNVTDISPLQVGRSSVSAERRFGSIYLLKTGDGTDLESLKRDYENLPEVEYAEINQIAQFHELPNDSLYQYQWSLGNSGQPHYHVVRNYGSYNDELILTNGLSGADIGADENFQNPPDKTVAVVAAIIDTGLDMDHPDLAANIWVNPGEIPDNGIDDDHNGYIDDVNGWDFAASMDPLDPGDNDPTDSYGHGSHCAGIIAGVSNNNFGIAGVAENCTVMGLKFDPLPLTSRIAAAIIYAADNGADVINMSFGFNYRSDLVEEALEYAHSKGVVLVASSGNDGTYAVNYPAGYDLPITIGSTNDSDMVSTFSTYGDHLDLCAPGQSIISLRADNLDMYASSYPREPGVHIVDSFFFMASGTSMSTPHVVGAAAVMRSVSPGLKPDKIKQILNETADDIIDPYGVGWNFPGYDQYSGHGRLNMYQALLALPQVRARIISPGINRIISGETEITGIADGAEFSEYSLSYGEGNNPEQWTQILTSTDSVTEGTLALWNTVGLSGRYTLRLDVGNDNASQVSVFVANDTAGAITYPSETQTVANFVSIQGNAYAPGFSHAILEYMADTAAAVWETIDTFSVPVHDGTLGGWFLEDLGQGDYILRLSVYSYDSLLTADSVNIMVQSIFTTDRAWKAELDGYPTIIPNYGDFDNDGINEILIGTSSGVHAFAPDGTPKTEGIPDFPDNNYMIPIAVGDLDDDGIDDIVALGYDPPKVYCFGSSQGNTELYLGVFPPIANFYRTEHEFPKVMLKDIDNDGRDEIQVFIYNSTLPETFIFDSDGTLINHFDYFSEAVPLDLDGDNFDELYAVNRSYGLIRQIDIASGVTTDSFLVTIDGSNFNCIGMSGYDIDNDDIRELIVYGFYSDFGYFIYAFDGGLNIIDGWPHDMGIGSYIVPTEPVFGDIDSDGEAEYLTTFFDIATSYVLAWNLDGTPLLPSAPNGTIAIVPEPSVLNMLLLADMDGNGYPDIVACANNDIFNSYEPQRIYAWNNEGQALTGFPLITSVGAFTSDRFTPVIGDIDRDGNIDLIMTTPDSVQIFVNYPGVTYDECTAPVKFWRYNRKMNNSAPLPSECTPTAVDDAADNPIPEIFYLGQNYPNPFNPTTTIRFSLPYKTDVTVTVYDLLGRNIRTLIDNNLPAGNHSVVWDGRLENDAEAASGIYFYRIESDSFSESRKMLLLK